MICSTPNWGCLKVVCVQKNKSKKKKVVPKLDSNSVPSACEVRALPSELLGDVNWAAYASKASVNMN